MCRSAWATLPEETAAAAAARRFVTARLARWGLTGAVDTAVLLASELVTNALLHGRAPFTVQVCATGPVVEIGVADQSLVLPRPGGQQASHDRPRLDGACAGDFGRGLLIVDTLSRRWGTSRSADGKQVWATLTAEPRDWNPVGSCVCPGSHARSPSGRPLTHVSGPWD